MRPASYYGAGVELEDVSKTLRRLQEPPPRPQPRGPTFSAGFVWVLLVAVLILGWLAWPRRPNADPLADGRLNNASGSMATPDVAPRAELVRANPNVPRAELVSLGRPFLQRKVAQWGESFWIQMPDKRWIVATAMGRVNSEAELPLSGNHIGDARWIGEHCFIWLNPLGQANPTWIDP